MVEYSTAVHFFEDLWSPLCDTGYVMSRKIVPVFRDEPSSMIAFCLNSTDYSSFVDGLPASSTRDEDLEVTMSSYLSVITRSCFVFLMPALNLF